MTLAASAEANVEVWDVTTSELLGRLTVPGTEGKVTAATTVELGGSAPKGVFTGWGLWRRDVAAPEGAQIEIRVWSPGGSDGVEVYSLGLQRVAQ